MPPRPVPFPDLIVLPLQAAPQLLPHPCHLQRIEPLAHTSMQQRRSLLGIKSVPQHPRPCNRGAQCVDVCLNPKNRNSTGSGLPRRPLHVRRASAPAAAVRRAVRAARVAACQWLRRALGALVRWLSRGEVRGCDHTCRSLGRAAPRTRWAAARSRRC